MVDGIIRYTKYGQCFIIFNVQIDCVELNEAKKNALLDKGHTVVGRDFFHFKTEKKYDYVIAAPNFKDNIDIEHIIKMWTHLKEGGRIVSLTSPDWLLYSTEMFNHFRHWLLDKNYYLVALPDNYFMENGVTVPTCIIVINK